MTGEEFLQLTELFRNPSTNSIANSGSQVTLAYGINEEYFAEIEEKMEEYLKIREKSNRDMVEALSADGFVLDYDEILAKSGKN